MANKKMTKVDMFKALKEKYDFSETEIAFIDHEIELIEKKNSTRKPTKVQSENELLKEKIVGAMESGKSYTVGEIQKLVGIETNQKASALVRQLRESGIVSRKEEKGKAYFTLVD